MERKRRTFIFEMIFIGALLVFLVFSFSSFMRENRQRIMVQNNSFIKGVTEQTVARLDDLIKLSQNNLEMLADLYDSVMTEPKVDPAMLQDMIDRSSFDYVEFISSDGMDLTADGRTADLSDREYFQRGMRGERGKTVIYNSRITNETLLIFYSPFYYRNEIIGVLSGILRGDTIYEKLTADYFDVQAYSYLLERDGNVILQVGDSSQPENLLTSMKEGNRLLGNDQEKLEQALANGTSTSFNYQGSQGAGSAYVTALQGGDWVLVQYFPSSVTNSMVQNASSVTMRLEVRLAAIFLLYILYLIAKNAIQKRQLVTEKQEMSSIVDAVTQLFQRFALVDYENDTYEYLEGTGSGIAEKGCYTDLMKYLDARYVAEDENSQRMSEIISPDYVREHLLLDVPYLQYEYQIEMDGRRWENISILCLERKNGVPVHVLYAVQDVTALKERELQIRMALKNASAAAEAANHAKSDFLARMSHDIRTPMNAIMGMTAVAAMHLDDRERLTDCLGKITISSRHLLALINDVLDMSKIESGKVTLSEEPFGMADMVESVITIVRPQVNARHQDMKVHISDIAHEKVIGDTLRLRQIFVNILGNAVKFTPEGGTITFSIKECESLIHGRACYEFICEDTGVGMDKEFLETIFNPFTRAQDSVQKNIEGTGLGMSITRNIVRMMDGDIQVESEPGVGSKFTVQVHLKIQEEETEDVRELAHLRVLVADDDRDSCESACEILQSIGMEPEWVLSGEEAVERTEKASKAREGYAALILDWKMPGMDGIETAREIRRKIGRELPIIILSAFDWSEVEEQAREAGIQAFIEKPLFRSRLVYALKSVLSREEEQISLEQDQMMEADLHGKRVLLVEDNEINREIAGELLAHIGVEVEQAENGREAVDKVMSNPPGYFDLVFMDVQMPVMNGYEAARQIRAMQREDAGRIPIIAMTANAFADDIREALDAGMSGHLAKPVEVSKLLDTLKKWL